MLQMLSLISSRRIPIAVAGIFLVLLLYRLLPHTGSSDTLKHSPSLDSQLSEQPKPIIRPAQDVTDGKFHWQNVALHHPVTSTISLPTNSPTPIPRIQHRFVQESAPAENIRQARQTAVKEAFEHSWSGYKKNAWLADEVGPLLGHPRNSFGGWGASLVDALDTLYIMGMKQEFEDAVKAIESIDFTKTEATIINTFETTIRYMGGFLGAYDLCDGQYPVLLEKAMELGEMLLVAFDTPNHMPITRWDWKKSADGQQQEAAENSLVAEMGSLTLEFTRLSQITGDMRYYNAVQRIMDHFEKQQMDTKLPGMWPVTVNPKDLDFGSDTLYSIGAMADSLYEYLPKEHLLLNGRTQQYRKMYEQAADVFEKQNFYKPMINDDVEILFSGPIRVQSDGTPILENTMQHLACYAGGMVAMAGRIFDRPGDLAKARKLTNGCVWAYDTMPNGLMPEVAHHIACPNQNRPCEWNETMWHSQLMSFETDKDQKSSPSYDDRLATRIKDGRLPPGYTYIDDHSYILRPEAIESVFILYRITGDAKYQDKAWRMFEAIHNHTRTEIAYAALDDVVAIPPSKVDRMESFWMAETLKYFYLIFSSPDFVSLDEYVFNTEAHPFKRPPQPSLRLDDQTT